ncbi:MAG: DUF4960 domain-containing protein [Candidatus Amulumruptor caecigallinarius]|nr:DUF4960 domain-containing protein [Candidatus Amulumruptor caecigallinarius]MCM1397744.1 DUF4960 domain-containing protein [Candidatus Amulumruptor caecigallinarius]MCM1453179.1 DUF4960 domain-containing protein [bacterium]
MKTIHSILLALASALLLAACQDNDVKVADPVLAPIDPALINGSLQGDDYVWTWPVQAGRSMQVSLYSGQTFLGAETVTGDTYIQRQVDTNIEYTYVFKLTDGTNVSAGVIKRYTRPGAAKMTGLAMAQVEKAAGYDASVTWDANPTAESIIFDATDGDRTIHTSLPAATTSYTISDVTYGHEWTVTLIAENAQGQSLPVSASLRIGKTAIGYLSIYDTPEELIADGDDDEASAWLWLHETYPTAQFIPFSSINSTAVLEPYRVLFWMRDIEGDGLSEDVVFNMPEVVDLATPYIKQWYADGGNLLLWSHATVYVGTLDRLPMSALRNNDRNINTGRGGVNPDSWSMAVSLNPGRKFTKDHSSHPIYKGLPVTNNGSVNLIPFKGPGWTEDHNCLFFNIPSALTGKGNQDEECYNELTQKYGIYPLGTWDSQTEFISQLNVWEAQQGDTDFKGTILCIGNGGCEFSMRNADGTPDKSAHPSNNIYQDNVLTLARNSLEYLKTR